MPPPKQTARKPKQATRKPKQTARTPPPPPGAAKINVDNRLHIPPIPLDPRPWFQFDYVDPAHKFVADDDPEDTWPTDVDPGDDDEISENPDVGPPVSIPETRHASPQFYMMDVRR
jgi:hypothetical protein